MIVQTTKAEATRGELESRNLEKAVGAVHRDGLVVVEDVIPHEILDHLNKKMVQDARALQARGEDGPFNYNLGNLQLDPPPVAEYFNPSIFTSKHSSAVFNYLVNASNSWLLSWLMNLNRSNRHPDHLSCARLSSEMDVLLRQRGDASGPRRIPFPPTRALGRRLQTPRPPLRASRQHPTHHHDSGERVDRAMARDTQPRKRYRRAGGLAR